MQLRKQLPGAETLAAFISYDPGTGDLLWKERPLSLFPCERSGRIWNTRYAGKPALHSMGSEGYFQGKFQGRYYRAHRIIWRLQTGESPDVIDHINGDRTDNRWANLRNVSWIENARNSAAPSCNLSGVAGVSFNRRHSSWRAYITVDRRLIHLGTFKEKAAAIAARRVAEVKHGFHVNHGRVAACA